MFSTTTPQVFYVFLMEEICGDGDVAHVESNFVIWECKNENTLLLAKELL